MKLSDVRGQRVFDVVADVIDPIVSIAEDEDAAALFKPEAKPEGLTDWQFFLQRVRRSLPALLKGHRRDFITIIATVNDVDPDEYEANLTLAQLLSDVTELITDREFTSFFG